MRDETEKCIRDALTRFLEERALPHIPFQIEHTGSKEHGDMTTALAFLLTKELQKAPLQIAEDIASYLRAQDIPGVQKIEAAGAGFLNIYMNGTYYGKVLSALLFQPQDFGKNTEKEGEVWAIEHTSPNPNKAMHLGHLRNNLVGMSIGQVLSWCGAKVIFDAIDNDRGIAIAKLMWGYLSLMRKKTGTPIDLAYWDAHREAWYTPEEKEMLPDVFVSVCYVAGDSACKDPEVEQAVRELVVQWEEGNELVWKVWSHVLGYAHEGIDRTLTRLGNRWDHVWHEHEHYQKGKEFVEKGLVQGVFQRLADGAVLTNLEAYHIPDTVLLKRDGTSLYITQDLALTALKKEKYRADHLVWVIGPDQSLALQQLFAVCEQLGIGKISEFTHVAYGYVTLKNKSGGVQKMSSRAGTVVLIDDVIDSVREALRSTMHSTERIRTDEERDILAEQLALAAVKFSILKTERTQDMSFDVERSVETKGDSGIYVMYTYVRTQSILQKARALGKKGMVPQELTHGLSVMKIVRLFPLVVLRAEKDLSVHHIAQYVLELAGAFNHWYATEAILDGGADEAQKIAVVEATGHVLKNSLMLMGITTVDEM